MARKKMFNDQEITDSGWKGTTMEKIEWLWYQRIPRGKVTLLVGDPGIGKGFLWMDIVARLTNGTDWPDCPNTSGPRRVAVIQSEDGLRDTIIPRAVAAGVNLDMVSSLGDATCRYPDGTTRKESFNLKDCQFGLEKLAIKHPDLELLIIDPITAYMGSGVDGNSNTDVRGVLDWLAGWADRHQVGVLGISHLNKNTKVGADYRILGSVGFTALARMVWHVIKDPDDEGRLKMLSGKKNLAPGIGGLAYKIVSTKVGDEGIETANIMWEDGRLLEDAEEGLKAHEDAVTGGHPGRRACRFLNELAKERDVVLASEVEALAAEAGINKKTLGRVRRQMGIKSKRTSRQGAWIWELKS